MPKSMWTPKHYTHVSLSNSKTMGINVESFAAVTAYILLERLSVRLWIMTAGICIHSSIKALVRSDTDVRGWRMTQSVFPIIPNLMGGVEVWDLVFPQQDQQSIALWTWICHAKTGQGLHQTSAKKLEAHYCLKYQCMLQKVSVQWIKGKVMPTNLCNAVYVVPQDDVSVTRAVSSWPFT